MLENKKAYVRRVNVIFIVGIIFSVISMLLPWYSFEISFVGEKFVWVFYPLFGWTTENSYEFTPPDMSTIIPYFYIFFLYAGLILPVRLFNSTMEEKTGDKYILYLIYFGAVLSGFIFILFLYLLTSQNFYIPYVQIDKIAGELVQRSIYSMDSGSIIGFFSLLLLMMSACFFDPPGKSSISNEEDQVRKRGRDFNSLEDGKIKEIRKKLLNLTPGEIQLLEKKFIDTRVKSIKTKRSVQI